MTLQLDHIVIAVHSLDDTIADYEALGFRVLRGGDHPGRVTHNALVVFADGSYFELIAWKEAAPQERWWQLLQRHGEGIVDYALLPADTAAAVAEAAQRGLVLDGPLDGGRLRPDGERLRWQTARPPSSDLPFLCGDLTPRSLRVPEGEARVHPNGAVGVASLAIAVSELDATLARFRALLGPSNEAPGSTIGGPVTLPGLRSRLALVALGSTTLVLSSPRAVDAADADESDSTANRDPIGLRLALRGQGPYSVVLRTAAGSDARELNLARTHGAHIELDGQGVAARSVPASAALS